MSQFPASYLAYYKYIVLALESGDCTLLYLSFVAWAGVLYRYRVTGVARDLIGNFSLSLRMRELTLRIYICSDPAVNKAGLRWAGRG